MDKEVKKLSMIAKEQTLAGTTMWNWLKLLWKNKFRVHFRYFHKSLFVSILLWLFIPFVWYERIRFNRKIRKTKIEQDPIFILGHWRSGTTYLHMLMTRNQNYSFASNLETFFPHVFLGSRKLFRWLLDSNMPKQRRQDSFKIGPDLPGEEDFAIANMSQLSYYHGLAFPNRRNYYSKYLTFENVDQKEIDKWKKLYLFYLKKLTYKAKGKRLVIKNPPNTGRIKLLLELFPNAKFIHIYRNPYEVYPSTVKMYHNLVPPFFLQVPDIFHAESIVLDIYEEIHRKFFVEKDLIPKGNLIELSYEEFLDNPLNSMERIYSDLSLDDFEKTKPALIEYINAQKRYKANVWDLPQETIATISRRWKEAITKFGYKIINQK
ncbi:MAG: sulfotransferase [Asgard group archaeon]|nr:sulfotransferase [Asgard group archaeon]